LHRIEAEKESREREERLRLEESERRARIEAETQLQQERMRLEAHAKTAAKVHRTPVGLIAGIVVAVLVIAGGVIFKIKSDHEKQSAALQAERTKEREQERLRLVEQERKMELLEASFKKQLAEAKSDAERLAIQKQLDDARAKSHASSGGVKTAAPRDNNKDKKESGSTSGPAPALIKGKKAVSDDPLDGLKL